MRKERGEREKDEPEVKRVDTGEEDGSVDTGYSIRDQLAIDLEGCNRQSSSALALALLPRSSAVAQKLTSHNPTLIPGQRAQPLPNLHDATLHSTGNGEARSRGGLAFKDVGDGYPEGSVECSGGDIEGVCVG